MRLQCSSSVPSCSGLARRWCIPRCSPRSAIVAHPSWRASAVGVYRFWRDLGYAIGALLAGLTADAFGLTAAMWLIAALTFVSGAVSAVRMEETLAVASGAFPDDGSEPGTAVPSSP